VQVSETERRREWLKQRRTGIGASDAAIILGLSPWKSPLALLTEKLGLDNPDDAEPPEMTSPQKWGLRLENAVGLGFAEETGRKVYAGDPYVVARNKDYPFIMATLDRTQVLTPDSERPPFAVGDGERGALELKTAGFQKMDDWEEEPPLYYQVQLQQQMFVEEYKWGSLAVLIGGQTFRYKDMERNDRFIELLVRKCREFWQHVQSGVPPSVDAHDSTKEALHRMFPNAMDLDVVPLPAEADDWDEQLRAAKDAIKAAEEQKTLAENHLKMALGDHVAGITPAGITYRWKNEPRDGYVAAPSNPRVLRRSEPKKKGKR
jgi:putative phage-type endonuclease